MSNKFKRSEIISLLFTYNAPPLFWRINESVITKKAAASVLFRKRRLFLFISELFYQKSTSVS